MAVATAPYQSYSKAREIKKGERGETSLSLSLSPSVSTVCGPAVLILFLKSAMPSFPAVCIVVLTVSIGVRTIRKEAAAADAAIVLTATGRSLVVEDELRRDKIPLFAA